MTLRTLGDVLARSGPCVTALEDTSIRDVANSLVRVDAVVVLSNVNKTLSGIATSRDVAKCIARNLDLDTTKVSLVMTANPTTLPPSETPANALTLMRRGRFRHIPIVHNDSTVIGVVDVLSLAYDAITRLQLSYSMIPSRRGYDLLRTARENIEKPVLRPILSRASVTTMSRNATVADACELIVTKHVAAIVIVDNDKVLDGIFTCTDVVRRVVSPKRDPHAVVLSKVMTHNPDCASPGFTILESLQRMQACGFRHLPVVDDHSRVVVGLVDVLQLASDTLLDLNIAPSNNNVPVSHTASRAQSSPPDTVPGLGRGIANFFSSLFSNQFVDRSSETNSVPIMNHPGKRASGRSGSSGALQGTTSAVQETREGHVEEGLAVRRHYGYMALDTRGQSRHARANIPLISFKFKDMNGDYRRIKVPMELQKGDFDKFMLDVRLRYLGSSCGSAKGFAGALKIKYVDEDGDSVLIANDDDLASCFEEWEETKSKTIILHVKEMDKIPSNGSMQSPVSSTPSSVVASPKEGSFLTDQVNEGALRPSVDPPPLLEPLRDPDRPTGVYRTRSRPVIHTPSSLKASEGHQMMLDKRIDEAIAAFTKALELNADNARAMGERGAAKLLMGSSVDAEEDYRSAIALIEGGRGGRKGDMTFQMCLVGLVESLIDQRRYGEAVSVALQMDTRWGNSGCIDALRDEVENSSNAAEKAVEAGEFSEAMVLYSNALRVESGLMQVSGEQNGRASLRLGRAKCYRALEDYDMALEDYEAAAKIEPNSVTALKGCGKCLVELEQMDRALVAYKSALELDKEDEGVKNAVETISKLVEVEVQSRRAEIAKLGAVLGGLNLGPKSRK